MQRHCWGPTVFAMSADVTARAQPPPPRIAEATSSAIEAGARLVAVGYTGSEGDYTLGAGGEAVLAQLSVDAFALLHRASATGKGGEVVTHELLGGGLVGDRLVEGVLLVGLGTESPRDYRRAGAAITRAARGRGGAATPLGSLAEDDQLAALVEGLVLGGFAFSRAAQPATAPHSGSDGSQGSGGSDADDSREPLVLTLSDVPSSEPGEGARRSRKGRSARPVRSARSAVVEEAVTRAGASWRARSFALTPSNEKGPVQLEAWSREAAAAAGLEVEVWDDERLAKEGFGGIVAVGSGSAYASRFVRLDYAPTRVGRRVPHIVIVGKGITFDTGGISIKPRAAMETMKRDMTGAGVVIAVMGALRALDVRVRVTGLVASAENAFGAASMRPGDIVTHYGGRTSEVANTDAEGRLVLADALAYAGEQIAATAVVDVATLTGAGKVALGTSLGALFANDETLAEALSAAGTLAGEPVWRLPLSQEYEPMLDNTFADATNAAGGPGSITAALFLQHFAPDVPWAHLDIASVGDSPRDAFEYTRGATGFGARLLLRWLATL